MAQYNVALTPVLRGKIITAQSIDTGVTHIKRRLTEGDPKVNYFHVDKECTLWFKDRLVVPKNMICTRRYLMNLTLPNIPSTQAAQSCIMI
jgi:hypothetical protein